MFQDMPFPALERVIQTMDKTDQGSLRLSAKWLRDLVDTNNMSLHINFPAIDMIWQDLQNILKRSVKLKSLVFSGDAPMEEAIFYRLELPLQLEFLEVVISEANTCLSKWKLKVDPSLKHLVLRCCQYLDDISTLQYCANMTYLDLSHCINVIDIACLEPCTSLTTLKLSNCNVLDISKLDALRLLKHLDLSCNRELVDIKGLLSCSLLEHLNLSSTKVDDLTPLYGCPKLKYLNLEHCIRVENTKCIDYLYEMEERIVFDLDDNMIAWLHFLHEDEMTHGNGLPYINEVE